MKQDVAVSNSLRIGIAGLGTVGAASAQILQRTDTVATLTGVNARTKDKDRGIDMTQVTWFDRAEDLAVSDQIDVFVELIGGDEGDARTSVMAALNAGKHVVTANKALLAKHGMELAELARNNGVALRFEAAIAGGIPIVKTVREGLRSNKITRVCGILNGTCNYILTNMEEHGLSFEDCLKTAQDLGYAEADPTFDVGGMDAAHKLALLSSLAFGHHIAIDDMRVEGIETITAADIQTAQSLGFKIKLLGVTELTQEGVEQRMLPTLVPLESAIARVDGVLNAVSVSGDAVGEVMLVGPGAGGDATGSAVISDVLDLVYGDPAPVLGFALDDMAPIKTAASDDHIGGYYVRFNVADELGVFAEVAQVMAKHEISLKSIMQNVDTLQPSADKSVSENQTGRQTVVLITHNTIERNLNAAIDELCKRSFMLDAPQILRIENLA